MQSSTQRSLTFLAVMSVGLVAIVALLVLPSLNMTGGPAQVSLNEKTEEQIALSEQIERELIQELAKLRTITLDDTIYTSEAFLSLRDYTRAIPDRPYGRENPFSPF